MSDADSEPDLLNELANDFAERYRRGERPSLSEYTARYPELADEIRDLFPAMAVIEQLGSAGGGPYPHGATPDGPAPRQLGEYRILREVARGGMGAGAGDAAPHEHRAGLRGRRARGSALLRHAVHPGPGPQQQSGVRSCAPQLTCPILECPSLPSTNPEYWVFVQLVATKGLE